MNVCVCVGYYLDVFKVNQHNNVMWVEWGAGAGLEGVCAANPNFNVYNKS